MAGRVAVTKQFNLGRRREMDATIVRVVAGTLFVVVLAVLVQRRRTRVK
jgi:hypothetical protein